MNFLSDEQKMWSETVNRFVDEEIGREYIRKCDVEREYPYEAYDKVAKAGWLGILFPEEYGGAGGDIMDYALMCEGLAKYGFDFATGVMVATFTAMNIVKFGTDEQKEKYLKPLLEGEIRSCFSMTEPEVSGADPTGGEVLMATYAFAFQIYCDFSGYSDIARGVARWFGFELMLNFRRPYFARNPSDLWRRWHISLSTWLRDYLYVPLGGNRGNRIFVYRNLMITMLLATTTFAAAPSVEQALKLKPVQDGIEYASPTDVEAKKCTIKAEKIDGQTGWVVRDETGQILQIGRAHV